MQSATPAQRYYQEADLADRWFGGPWRRLADCAAWPLAQWHGRRSGLAELCEQALAAQDADAHARASAARIADPQVVCVLCGQQPAYAGGPLFNLIKVAQAIALARQLCAEGCPALPLFWCASDDHDLDEARHCSLIHSDGRLQRLSVQMPRSGCALHRQPALLGWQSLCEALEELAAPALGRDWLYSLQPRAGEGLGTWQCRMLQQCFAGSGLLCLEARDLRPLWTQGLGRLLDDWPSQAIAQRHAEVVASGWPDAFGLLSSPPLFLDTAQGRVALSLDAARQQLRKDPSCLSPGAALRPVLQQWVLPAAVYCAGPGELAYHAFLGPIYEQLAVPAPRLVPRISVGLLDSRAQRCLQRHQLDPEDLRPGKELPQPTLPPAAQQALQELEKTMAGLQGLAEQSSGAIRLRLRSTWQRLQREHQALAQHLRRDLERAQAGEPLGVLRQRLFPRQRPQERVLSSLQALWHYGPGLTRLLIEAASSHPPAAGYFWLRLDHSS